MCTNTTLQLCITAFMLSGSAAPGTAAGMQKANPALLLLCRCAQMQFAVGLRRQVAALLRLAQGRGLWSERERELVAEGLAETVVELRRLMAL